ncbi:VWA domain-containing protein [Povalibacter sp.]|uniref:VWA domain-containing protein n=1 Tax=Povalibacter sp. TaxID=1962978 RepID=UPI002F4253D4
MMHVAWPWMALLLPLPWLLYRLRAAAQSGGTAIYLPFVTALGTASAERDSVRLGLRALFVLIWILLVAAAVRPQWLGDPLPVPTTGRRLMLAVDVSGSMEAQDMANNATRLQVVQAVAGNFIDGRRGDQVGLIIFGTQPYLQAPLSPDLATVHRFLDEAAIGIAGQETAIGDAIGLALKRQRAEPNKDQQNAANRSVLILLTDGQSNAGAVPPLEAAKLAAQQGLRIYTIGVGATGDGGFFGSFGNMDLDEDTLQAIARITGGRYFPATDANALREVYREIDKLEPAAGREQWWRPADEWFRWPLGLALLLSVPALVLGTRTWT